MKKGGRMLYHRFCEGLQDRGKFIPAGSNLHKHVKNTKKDHYKSIFLYTEEQKAEAETQVEVIKNGKTIKRNKGVSGMTDLVTNELVFDFDSLTDIESAKEDTKVLVSRLKTNNISEEDIKVYFSGKKGFAVHVLTSSEFTPSEFKNITSTLAEGLSTYDSVVANASRLIRVPYTKHQSTEMFKTRITSEELNLSVNEIIEIAKEEYDFDEKETAVDLGSSILALKVSKDIPRVIKQDYSDRPDMSRNPFKLTPRKCVAMQGFFLPGTRSTVLLMLASSLKNRGLTEDECYSILKATIRSQSARFGQEIFSKEEFYETVISQVYASTWNGGTYSEGNLPKQLLDYYDELGIPKADDVIDEGDTEELVVGIGDQFETFNQYAFNIDKNTIQTGIKSLDDKLKMQRGELIGILAPPSVGKTSIALTILNNTSERGIHGYFGSYDMSSNTLFQKLIQRETGLERDALYDVYRNNDTKKIGEFKEILEKHYKNVTFSFKTGDNIEGIKRSIKLREEKLGEELPLVLIDYLELVRCKSSDPTQASAEAIQGLREIANGGTGTPKLVIVLLQPNKMSSRIDEPLLTYNAAKGSSAIAQACTAVLTMHRPGMSSEFPESDLWLSMNCVKNRMGELFNIDLSWHGLSGKVDDLSDESRRDLQALRALKKLAKEIDKNGNDF